MCKRHPVKDIIYSVDVVPIENVEGIPLGALAAYMMGFGGGGGAGL